MSDGALQVDIDAIRDLASRAATLGGDIGALGAAVPELGVSASGSAAVTGSLADFAAAVLDRASALQAEFEDASEFLSTFADTMAAADGGAAASRPGASQ